MRFIIIDDELLVANALAGYLTQVGHQVVGMAGTIPKALGMIDAVEFDVALIDLFLNGRTAEAVVEQLRDRQIATVIITACPEELRPGWALNCVTKPFTPEQLLDALQKLKLPCSSSPTERMCCTEDVDFSSEQDAPLGSR